MGVLQGGVLLSALAFPGRSGKPQARMEDEEASGQHVSSSDLWLLSCLLALCPLGLDVAVQAGRDASWLCVQAIPIHMLQVLWSPHAGCAC